MEYISPKPNNVLDIEELSYHNNFVEMHTILTKWLDAKPTEDMIKVHTAFTEISLYVMAMQKRQRQYDQQISMWRKDRNRAIQKLREQNINLKPII